MVRKTVSIFKRWRKSWRGEKSEAHRRVMHLESVVRETWWLFGFIPIYSRDGVTTTNL